MVSFYSQVANGEMPAEGLIEGERGMSIVPDCGTGNVRFLEKRQTTATGPNRPELRSEAELWSLSLAEKKAAAVVGSIRSVVGISPIGATVSPDAKWLAYTVGTDATRASL